MYQDILGTFAKATAIGGSTGRRLVGDVVDLGAGVVDIGHGSAPYLAVRIATAMTSGGAATVQIELVSDAQEGIAVDGTATVHYTSAQFAFDAAGVAVNKTPVIIELPSGIKFERYLGIIVNVGTAALTAGAIDAFLTPHEPGWLPRTSETGRV